MKKLILVALLLGFVTMAYAESFKFELKPEYGGCCKNCKEVVE